MVVISLAAAAGFRAGQARKAAFRKTIAIRPDAKTGNRNWPCRELNRQRTPIHPRRRSRFGECDLAAACSREVNPVIPPSLRHCRPIPPWLCCTSVLHWQACPGWVNLAQSVDVAPILDKAVAAKKESWNGEPRSSI
jgi:hypothetical protein